MRMSKKARTLVGLVAGAGAVASVGALVGADAASAKTRGGAFRVIDCNVRGLDDVFQNGIIELTFTADVDPSSVNPAIFQVRERNATGTGYTKQVPGSFQFLGSKVRFFPRLPTHLRDPASDTEDFYGVGTPRDDAEENAGLKPDTSYEIKIVGGGVANSIRSASGRRLAKSYTARFSTTATSPKSDAFTIETYGDSPPPEFVYSNPSDKVASPEDQYAKHGGTRDVPNAINVTLFGNRVPLSPNTLRQGSNVSLQLTERNGDTSLAKPIRGTPFVEQNLDGVRMVYKPFFPLPDRGTYALRLTKDVKDLTEQYDFRSNPERLRLRDIYEYMVTAQALSPTTPPELLPNPPIDLIYDWPTDETERGILKRNVLELGNTYPEEVDPRVMVLFSTRDEPVSDGSVTLEFVQSDGLLDESRSTAGYDENIPGAASGVLTISGGSGVDGDYLPTGSETINIDDYAAAGYTINWRKVIIPPGAVITIQGTRPATIKSFQFQLDGEIRADGRDGQAGSTSYSQNTQTPPEQKGGAGGPGGGKGGNSSTVRGTASNAGIGITGTTGNDVTGTLITPPEAGGGGLGGGMGADTNAYQFGGGGGGGGARTAGTSGSASTAGTYTPTWNGNGGAGGAGSSNDDLIPLAGGAGGGSGGNSQYYANSSSYNWVKTAGSGGGGGGALTVQTAGTFNIGTTGIVRARGGRGGAGSGNASTLNAGPGGGGGGGSLLLRTSRGFNISNPGGATDVRGGTGGTQTGTYTAPSGGTGGTGYVRTEDPNGGAIGVPGASSGTYDPVGGGVPSVLWTTWIDLGVDAPRMVNFANDDFILNAAGNDAILIEMQMAIEDPNSFGTPLLDAVTASGDTTDITEVSAWTPVRVTDLTSKPGGAFGNIPGYDPSIHGTDYIIPVDDVLNGYNYKFFRVRITFQLDDTQTSRDPFPFVDRLVVNFQFNI